MGVFNLSDNVLILSKQKKTDLEQLVQRLISAFLSELCHVFWRKAVLLKKQGHI